MSHEANHLEDALFSLGTPALEKHPLCITQSAEKALSELGVDLGYEKKDKTPADLMKRRIPLTASADGSIPNAKLLPASALIICTIEEANALKGHWIFLVA